MKRNTLLKSITVSVALSAFLTGCGSSATTDENNANNNSAQPVTVSGKAVDGYLQYATVCLDMNQDGYCQATEPSTQTDEGGKFTLAISPDVQKSENYDLAMLLVYGGKDVDTGDDFKGKLLAPKDGDVVMVTPINTLIAKAVQKELKQHPKLSKEEIREKIKVHKKRVAQALDIPEEEINQDPVKLQREGKPQAIEKALQLQKAVEAFQVGNDGTVADHERAEKIYEALVDGLEDMNNEQGIDALLEKTLNKAQTDPKVRELIGGERGVKLGKAAKSVAQNVKERFEKFKDLDPEEIKNEDLLKKIAAGTDLDLHKVEIAFEEGTVDTISGQITVDDTMFQAGFDWDAEFIKGDLAKLGIHDPKPELINKIKALFHGNEKIRPGILFVKKERLAHADDADLKKLYERIEQLQLKKEQKHEMEKAKRSDKIVTITPPMDIFMPEKRGYGKVTFGSDNTLSFQKYKITQDGKFVAETNDEQDTDFIFKDGQWVEESDNGQAYTLDADGGISLPTWNEKAYLVTPEEPIAGQTKKFPQYHISATMPDDAKMYFLKIKKQKDTYMLNNEEQKHTENGSSPYTSISDFIKTQCETRWFEGDHNGGLAFAGEQRADGYTCDGSAKKGKLVYAQNDANGTKVVDSDAGSWEIKTVEGGTEILIVKPYNLKRFHDDEGDIEYPIFTMKDGTLYRGDMEPAGVTRVIPVFNESAMQSITNAVTENWSNIANNMPSFYDKGDYNKN